MDSEKKDKKPPYVPPVIYELDVDPIQAMGQTQCDPYGSSASAQCTSGECPTTLQCCDGAAATTRCDTGGTFVCNMQ